MGALNDINGESPNMVAPINLYIYFNVPQTKFSFKMEFSGRHYLHIISKFLLCKSLTSLTNKVAWPLVQLVPCGDESTGKGQLQLRYSAGRRSLAICTVVSTWENMLILIFKTQITSIHATLYW